MGTTLTGTKPKDTYDSLIKVTDNGPLGATAKLLTDGLGNDSVLYLGTAGLGIKATSILSFNNSDSTHSVGYDSVIDGSQLRGQNGIRFSTGSGSGTERLRILAGGGITFNGDTAAANALDDYEEGTWTMGVTFGGASVGVTYNNNLGTYTKIGRQVTVNGWVNISAVGSSTGAARITGLPFTVGNTDANYAGTTLACNKIAFANQLQAFAERGTNTILFTQVTEAGVESTVLNTNFQAGSYAIISLTYFV
jgi:hypothetical protein